MTKKALLTRQALRAAIDWNRSLVEAHEPDRWKGYEADPEIQALIDGWKVQIKAWQSMLEKEG